MFAVPRGTQQYLCICIGLLILYWAIDNSKRNCDLKSTDITHPEAQRSTDFTPHCYIFPNCKGTKWSLNGFRQFAWDANWRTPTPRFTHSFLSAAMTSAGGPGKQICDLEEKALQGEACLNNRIVPVCITLPTRVTLDDVARKEVYWM